MEVYDITEENELDTYMIREVPVPEGDEAKILTQEELGQGQEDSITNQLVPQVSSLKTPNMFDSLIKLFEYKNIIQKMDLRKQLKNVKIENA